MATGYPDNWEQIADQVKEAAGWRCEHCGHPHDLDSGHVLTVHHLDGEPANCAADNLVALCQRCHLRIQARYRPGQLTLPGIQRPGWMIQRKLGLAAPMPDADPLDGAAGLSTRVLKKGPGCAK